jgi:hypothetical protein
MAIDDTPMVSVWLLWGWRQTSAMRDGRNTAMLSTTLRYKRSIEKFHHEHHQCERSLVVMMSALHVI